MSNSPEDEVPISTDRIQRLNEQDVQAGDFVTYWMQASQREEWNHALEYTIYEANRRQLTPLVVFGITADFPEANARHYRFMLEGLQETQEALRDRGVEMVIRCQSPEKIAMDFADISALMVTDRGYTTIQRQWRQTVAENIVCPLIQVESDVVVPVEVVSSKREYAARTIRPKIHQHLDNFMGPVIRQTVSSKSTSRKFESEDLSDLDKLMLRLDLDRSVKPVTHYRGGTSQAERFLETFITEKLDRYADERNDPANETISHMSPYLHFGQISPVYIAMKVNETKSPGNEDYLEELIIRRELSMNFCYYTENYDELSCLPDWAQKTLHDHEDDPREYVYSLEIFERGETHDPYWNAAQMEMVKTGKMHGYMRMYWGKKILEWTDQPEEAYRIALYLNNKYELDGRDPNGFAGVAWCFGNHDQGWKERPVYGKVRYMNANGLRRKFDIDEYVEKVKNL